MTEVIRQHYVPQSLLKNFSSDTVNIYTIRVSENLKILIENKKIKEVFCERYYFRTLQENYDRWFDDDKYARIFREILSKKIIPSGAEFRHDLCEIISLQFLRGIALRKESENLQKILEERFKSDYDELIEFLECFNNDFINQLTKDDRHGIFDYLEKYFPNRKESVKNIHADLFKYTNVHTEIFKKLNIELIQNSSGKNELSYVVSGSPVIKNQEIDEYYFPINPDYCIWLHPQNLEIEPLESRILNEIQWINGAQHCSHRIASKNRETLEFILNNPLDESEISQLPNSYWKYVLYKMFIANKNGG